MSHVSGFSSTADEFLQTVRWVDGLVDVRRNPAQADCAPALLPVRGTHVFSLAPVAEELVRQG